MSHAVYTVASGKGGVGKTTTTVNLGTMLAASGHEVVVVDADLGMANLADFLGLEPSGATLHDVLAGDASVESAVHPVEETDGKLSVLPSGVTLDEFGKTDPENMGQVVGALRDEYDYVLVDTGAGLSYDTVLPLGLADAVLLVSTPWTASIRDVNKTSEVTERVDGTVAGAVLTQVDPTEEFDVDDVADRIDAPVLAAVPQDDAVRESVTTGTPLAAYAPDSPATEVYESLATLVAADDPDDAPETPIVAEPVPEDDLTGAFDDAEPTFDPDAVDDAAETADADDADDAADEDDEPEFPRFDEEGDDDPLAGDDDLSDLPDLDD